jgi:deoxycytidine triphosphate deaminase
MIKKLKNNIEPFREENLQPASLDIALGDKFLIERHKNRVIDAVEDKMEYLPKALNHDIPAEMKIELIAIYTDLKAGNDNWVNLVMDRGD